MRDYVRELRPHEEALGIFLNHPDIFREKVDLLNPEVFLEHEWLFKLMKKVEEREGLTVQGLMRHEDVPLNELPEIRTLHQTFFNENRIDHLIQEAKKTLLKHKLMNIAQETKEKLSPENMFMNPDDILRDVQETVLTLSTSDSDVISNNDRDVEEWFEHIMKIVDDPSSAYGLLSGIGPIDRITNGFYRQHMSVLGGYTSMGKTALALHTLLEMNAAGYKCAIFSLEMSKRDLYTRMMSNRMQVNHLQFKKGKLARNHYESMAKHKDELKRIYVDDTRGLTADQICDKIRFLKRKQGLDFVIVDYLQDVSEPGEGNDNSGSALSRVCRKLRKVALQADVHIMALSQIARGSTNREDKRPTNSDLSGSTGIETSADVIMLLYRDEYFNPNTDKKGIIEVNFTKQRNGSLGMAELIFDKETQTFRE